jgi:hypothetical protein
MIRLLLVGATLAGAAEKPTTLITPPFSHDMGFHRASKFYIDMYLGRSFKFHDPEGLAAEKLLAEDDTTTSLDDHIVTLLGVNSGSGQIVYNTGVRRLGSFGRTGTGDGEFQRPHGIAVNRRGAIYVADTDNNRLVRLQYTRDGLEFVRNLPGFEQPIDVKLDSRGSVYLTERTTGLVRVLDTLGRETARWGGFEEPTGLFVIDREAPRNYYADDFAVVIDRRGRRLSKCARTGAVQVQVEARDIGLAAAEFSYAAVDYYANVYVTDRYNDQIHKFDRDLRYLVSYGRSGGRDGEFNSPRGIAIARQFGQVFIGEAEGGQYYWIGLDAFFVGCFPEVMTREQPGTTIVLYITEVAELTMNVLDRKNRLVRNLYPGTSREKPGEIMVVWDGRDNQGLPVGPGEYTISALLRPTYGGMRRILKKELTCKVKRI